MKNLALAVLVLSINNLMAFEICIKPTDSCHDIGSKLVQVMRNPVFNKYLTEHFDDQLPDFITQANQSEERFIPNGDRKQFARMLALCHIGWVEEITGNFIKVVVEK